MNLLNTLNETGYVIVQEIYAPEEINAIEKHIAKIHGDKPMFGERRFLQRTPGLLPLLLNTSLRQLLNEIAPGYFLIKSIYFDKAPRTNWFVSWHQDLSICVKEKVETPGFKNWTQKENEYGVQPPTEYLGAIITLRIHLDDTDEHNGALKVIPHSHSEGVLRSSGLAFSDHDAALCPVKAGGVMLMKPLLFHSSSRATNEKPRRVIHLELCNMELPEGLEWAQKITLDY
jgi:hypothetical protein